MKKIIILIILCINNNSLADCAKFENSCKIAIEVQVGKIDKSMSAKNTLLNFREVLGNDVKCTVELENAKMNFKEKIFSHICEFEKNIFSYVSSVPYCNDIGESKEESVRHSDIQFLWYKGNCSRDSEKLFYKLRLESVTTSKKLIKNKFLLVSEDEKSQTYYANPGYVVKLEKNDKLCKKNKNCELNIILKKRLNSAILDADGKLHTDESL